MDIGFVGLGVMAYPMAGHLQAAGHNVRVYNRTTEKAQPWALQYGGAWATTPAEAAADAGLVCVCVGNDDDVRSVVLGAYARCIKLLGSVGSGQLAKMVDQICIAGQYDHGFAVGWMRKYLAMVLTQANKVGLSLPLTSMVDGFYEQVQAMGGGRWDTSSLLARMQQD